MRILLASDLHYTLRQYDWLARSASHFDAIAIAGDHVDIASAVPHQVQMAALAASFSAIAQVRPTFVCSGNHDLDDRNAQGEKTAGWLDRLRGGALAVDGDSRMVGDTLFTVCPWWDGPHAREGVERLLDEAAAQRRGRWVWLYHAPPESPLSWNGKRHFGDPLLPALVQRHAPTAVLCGHIHEAPFRNGGGWATRMGQTWLFNAGRQIGEVPAFVEIDLDALTARWVSLAGMEEQALAA